jgi:hypothetical protein
MVGEICIANGGANLQPAVGCCFDLVERQPVDVDDPRWRFDVQLHQIQQRRAAGDEPHVGALLRSVRWRGARHRRRGIGWSNECKGMHGIAPARS